MNYKHGELSVEKSTGVDIEELRNKTTSVLEEFIENDEKDSWSYFTEAIENKLSKRELAILSTQHMVSALEEAKSEALKENPTLKSLMSMQKVAEA